MNYYFSGLEIPIYTHQSCTGHYILGVYQYLIVLHFRWPIFQANFKHRI